MIDLLPEQKEIETWAEPCAWVATDPSPTGSKAYAIYGQEVIEERHRHRYEVNNHYYEQLKEHGMDQRGVGR